MRAVGKLVAGFSDERLFASGAGNAQKSAPWAVACVLFLALAAFGATRAAKANPEIIARADQRAEALDLDGARQVLEKYLESHTEVGPVWQRLRQIYTALARETLARSLDLPDASGLNGVAPKSAGNGARSTAPPSPTALAPTPVPAAPTPASRSLTTPPAALVANAPEAPRAGGGTPPVSAQAPASAPPTAAPAPPQAPVAQGEAGPRPAMPNPAGVAQGPPRGAAAIAEMEALTRAWASAWSARELDPYLSFYAPGFVGSGARDRAAWVEARRIALERAQDLNVKVEGMTVRPISAARFEVRFRQAYRSANLSLDTWKSLVWEWERGRWTIVSEKAGADRRR